MKTTLEIKQKSNKYHLHNYFAPYCELVGGVTPLPSGITTDVGLFEYFNNLYRKLELSLPVLQSKPAGLPVYESLTDEGVMLGFTGGKDGLAVAIKLKQAGVRVVLYHLYGVNRTYRAEVENMVLSKALGMPFYRDDISIHGKQGFPDHPFKNQLIMANMVDFGKHMGIYQYALGNHNFEAMAGGNVELEFSDSGEQIHLFDMWVKQYVPQYTRSTWLENNVDALVTIINYNSSLLGEVSSCITPAYRKPMMQQYINKHFGMGLLLKGRCGYCYKCTKEYIVLTQHGVLPYNNGMYEHCVKIQRHKSPVTYI